MRISASRVNILIRIGKGKSDYEKISQKIHVFPVLESIMMRRKEYEEKDSCIKNPI